MITTNKLWEARRHAMYLAQLPSYIGKKETKKFKRKCRKYGYWEALRRYYQSVDDLFICKVMSNETK